MEATASAAKAGRPNQNLLAVDLSKAGLPAALFVGLARYPLGGLKDSVYLCHLS